MTSFVTSLKDEIRRLARKEIKAQIQRTSRAVAQYRREIARLKRQLRENEKRIGQLESQVRKPQPLSSGELNGSTRFSSRSVKAQRRRTGLSASDYARLLGVSPLTIYNWEQNKSRPRNEQFGALVALRGLGKREARSKLALLDTGSKKIAPRRRRRSTK